MRYQPRYSKVDRNQKEIVEFLKWQGFSVFQTSSCGKGFPDLVVGKGGKNYLIEIKTKEGKLTKDQEKFHSEWRGEIVILRSIDDAVLFNMGVR